MMKATTFVISGIALCVLLSGCASPDDVQANGVLLKTGALASQHSLATDNLSPADWPKDRLIGWWYPDLSGECKFFLVVTTALPWTFCITIL
jgi:hypothetical protein